MRRGGGADRVAEPHKRRAARPRALPARLLQRWWRAAHGGAGRRPPAAGALLRHRSSPRPAPPRAARAAGSRRLERDRRGGGGGRVRGRCGGHIDRGDDGETARKSRRHACHRSARKSAQAHLCATAGLIARCCVAARGGNLRKQRDLCHLRDGQRRALPLARRRVHHLGLRRGRPAACAGSEKGHRQAAGRVGRGDCGGQGGELGGAVQLRRAFPGVDGRAGWGAAGGGAGRPRAAIARRLLGRRYCGVVAGKLGSPSKRL